MATGLLFDVPRHLVALDAVLAEARAVDTDRWVLGGDSSSSGAGRVGVVDRLDKLDEAVWIRGNWDRWQAGDAADLPDQSALAAGLAAVREALGPEYCERLGA